MLDFRKRSISEKPETKGRKQEERKTCATFLVLSPPSISAWFVHPINPITSAATAVGENCNLEDKVGTASTNTAFLPWLRRR